MKWIICLGILATSVSHCQASETWEVDSDSLESFEAHALAFDTLFVNGLTKRGEARLIETLLDQRSYSAVRIAAIDNLTRWSPVSPAARETLLEVISTDTDVLTCCHAISKLKESGIGAAEAIPVLLRAAGDTRSIQIYRCSDFYVSSAAISAIGDYGDEAAEAMQTLISVAEGGEPGSSFAALNVLGRVAPWDYPFHCRTEAAIRPLAIKLSSQNRDEALAAAKKLLEMHTMAEPAVHELELALGYGDDQLRLTAAVALLAISPFHFEAQQVFAAAAERSRGWERGKILNWVDTYNLPYHVTPLLLAMLNDSDCRVHAARELAKRKLHEEQALATLVELYNSGDKSSQQTAIAVMRFFRPELLRPHRGLLAQAAASGLKQADRLLETIPPDETGPSEASTNADTTAAANP
jgi:HEAT repeat protein